MVEDNPKLRSMIRDMLTEAGHTVIETALVEEARDLLENVPDISLVLSDIKLEGAATGVDLARNVNGTLPMFLMTSLPESDPLYTRGAALAPVLRKPFTADQLAKFLTTENAQ